MPTETDQDQWRGGGRTRLNKPTTARPKPTLARKDPNLPGKGSTHEIRDQWGLVDENTETTEVTGIQPRVTYRVMRYSLEGNVVGLPRRACNGCADLHELG